MTSSSGFCAPEPIAVIGFALKFPQEVTHEEALWKLLIEKRSTMTDVPPGRWNSKGFYKPEGKAPGTVVCEGGHFLADDPARFDAPFFSIKPAEAECLDPQQRFLLETTYQALENAGIPMEKAVGTRASVHVGCSLQEYAHICLKDTDLPGAAKVVGAGGLSMLASRLSWFYDFTGPSMTLDTACSSGLLAVHLACNDILSGAVDMGVACGANLSLIPGPTTLLSALNMMSPTSICYSFDDRANGYSRSEGFGVVLLKKLSKAIADGDTIRGVIRATGTNQDGRTPGITQPSGTAQERLTRETYAKAGLDMNLTRYFEAHGTGTKIGDPTEASAISNAFSSRTPDEPMYIGALKSNMGHAEATSGIAGLIKSLLVLEHGVIPPNKYPERLNPVIAANWPQLKFPQEPTPWPTTGTKRISVNSFGYGGSNIHVILDDVVNFLKENGLTAKHNTIIEGQERRQPLAIEQSDALSAEIGAPNNKLLVLSAFDQRAVERMSAAHEDWLHSHDVTDNVIGDLAYTLSAHRSRFTWKTFSTASPDSLKELSWSTPVRVRHDTKVCFVFTGQGAQYYGMGRELYKYEAFRKSMQNTDAYFKELGAEWSLIDELYTVGAEKSNINRPELSQPICSAIQVAMLDLLTSWNIKCTTVIGHSSGEIAAAYASGAISRNSALMAAYYRGLAVAITRGLANIEGSMAAVLAKPELVEPHMAQHNAEHPEDKAVIACYNSPSNVTISGSKTAVARMIDILEGHGLTSRQLKVDVGYHSHHMNLVGEVYAQLMSPMEVGTELSATFVSTVTEQVLDDTSVLRTSDYWCRNLTGSVRFSQTLAKICGGGATAMADMFVELGPHSTLRSPIKDILAANGRNVMNDYTSVLVRKLPADIAALECAGKLHTVGMPVDLVAVNGGNSDRKLVTTLPPYLFNDKTKYWLEGRTSAANRFRTHVYNEFLGTRVDDWNDCEPRWTNRIILDKATWLKDHIVNGLFIFPAAGFMAMALEATRQIYGEGETSVLGYKMRDVKFPRAVSLSTDPHGTELQIALKTSNTQPNKTTAQTATWDQFTIYVFEHNVWAECCSGHIKVEYKDETQQVSARDEREEFLKSRLSGVKSATDKCNIAIPRDEVYEAFSKSGLPYGPFFNALKDVRWNGNGEAVGAIDIQQWKGLQENHTDDHLIHPSALDTILQTTFPALSIYSRHAHSTTVPTGFRSAWFSANIANAQPELQTTVHAKVVEKGFRDKLFAIAVAKKNLDSLLFSGEMEASTIGGTVSDASGAGYKPLYRIEYKPDIDLLPPRNLSLEAQSSKDTSLVQDKKMLCLSSMRSALDSSAARQVLAGSDDLATHLQEYVQWMQAKTATQTETTSESLESLCQRLESVDVESQLLVRVARALPAILAGEVDPLNLLFSDELLNDFHANFKSNQQLLARAAEEIDLMAHKNPQLRVLEIGAGTGTATEHILAALGDRVTEYVYTDVTQSFFLKARGKFSSPKVSFKTLDISQDPIAQGYQKGEFDVIVAANALHETGGIQNALTQCRTLLKPDGRIVLLETTNRDYLLEPYIFGLLPGLSSKGSPEYEQNQSPLLTESEWAQALLETGFSGLDTCINDAGYITPESNSGVLISRAVAPTKKSEPTTIKVAYDPTDAQQLELVKQMEASTANDKNVRVVSVVWEGAQLEEVIGQHCVFLIDVKGNFLGGMDKETAYRFKGILRTAKTLVWVTRYNTAKDRSPDYALVQGLVRTLATENDDCKVFSVALEEATGSRTAATNILKVTNAHLSAKDEPEDEYVEINGTLHVPRVTKADDMAAQVHATEHKVTLPWGQLQQPSLTIGTVGRLNTLVFEQEIVSTEPLKAEEVLVEIRAVGLSNRDLLVAQGHVHDDTFGSEFAAVVKKSGSGNSFKVGDNVFGIAKGAMSSERRVNASQLQKMPQGMDFTEAATYPVAFTTAYYSLVHCARLRHGETILVHGAATELGQSVIQLAQQHNCEVFITVDSSEQAIALQEKYNIPRSHTFSSQTSDFASAVRRLTQGRGVDVAVTSRAGEIARDSWDCLATFGRLIGIGGNNTLTNFPAGKSRMFVDVNIQELAQTPEFAAVFDEVAKLMASNKLTLDTSIRVLGLNDVKTAFRQLANADHSGRMAIKMDKDEVIEMVLAANTNSLYDANSSYLLAGGFGGIGQDLSRWMIQNGCKNLILPARSRVEGTGSEREKFLNELRAMGCDVRAPLCDITDKKALQKTIADLKDSMPPIKGAIQSAMTLRDSSFQNMTMEDWHAGLSPKLVGSWNLHETLPNDLDFFIMFSSTLGIMGSFGQANYTSGNTYEDALAIHRVRHGHRAHAVALGMVVGVGMVAEDEGIAALLKARGMLEEVTPEDIYDLVRFCCNPSHACVGGQVITPLSLPKDFHAMGIIEPAGFERPIYSHLQILPSRHAAALENSADAKKLPSHSLPSATSLAEATNIITEAIQAQLSSLLVVSKDDIDPKKPIHKYGVDSLVAVEMKNWFMKGVGADVGTADILGHSGISELAAKVATRSKFVKDELKA